MIWDTTKYYLTYDNLFREIYVKKIKSTRKTFFSIIEKISKENFNNVDWWVSPIGERNNYSTKLFHYLCIIETIEVLYKKKIPLELIILENYNLISILKKKYPKFNFKYKNKKRSSRLIITVIQHFIIFFLSKLFMKKKLKNLNQKTILVDKFVSSPDLSEDRYYNNFFEKNPDAIYFPTLVNIKLSVIINLILQIQKSKKYFNKFDLLTFRDFLHSIFYIFRRKKIIIKKINFKNIILSNLIYEEIGSNNNLNASIIGIQNYLFSKKLAEKKIIIKKMINWFENTAVDKGLNFGFNKFLKKILLIGYQGFTSYKEFMSLDPVDYENKYNVLPKKIVCIGKNLISSKTEFTKNHKIILGPALRFGSVYEKLNYKKKHINSVLLNLNLDYQNSNLMIQNILKTDFYNKYNGKIYIKSHPLFKSNQIFNLKNKNNIYFVKGDIYKIASSFNVAISSGATSSIHETIVAGCKICFPFDNFTDAYSLKMTCAPLETFKVCKTISELSDYLIKNTQKSSIKNTNILNYKKKIFNKLSLQNSSILR